MNLTTLTDLLLNEMRDLLDAEEQLLKTLPALAESSYSPELKGAFDLHISKTRTHVERLQSAFRALGTTAQGKHCRAMEGLLDSARELIDEQDESDPIVLDAGLITAAQKIEHYEMAGYGSARTFARRLGAREVERLLQATLDEEAEADRKLTQIAEGRVNPDAAEIDERLAEESDALDESAPSLPQQAPEAQEGSAPSLPEKGAEASATAKQ